MHCTHPTGSVEQRSRAHAWRLGRAIIVLPGSLIVQTGVRMQTSVPAICRRNFLKPKFLKESDHGRDKLTRWELFGP